MSTFNKVAIFTSISSGGWVVFEHHFEIVEGSFPNCSASHLPVFLCSTIIRKSKFPQNPKRSVRFSGKRTKRSVQKRKARNTQKAETKVL